MAQSADSASTVRSSEYNPLPSEHVKALHDSNDKPSLKDDILRNIISPPFALRPYDYQPRRHVLLPRPRAGAAIPQWAATRGRRRTSHLSSRRLSAVRACPSRTRSSRRAQQAGRRRTTSRSRTHSHILLTPIPDSDPPKPPRGPIAPAFSTRNWTILIVTALILLTLLIAPWLLYRRANHRLLRANQQLAASPGPAGDALCATITPSHSSAQHSQNP